jgi:hypothetical protein
MTIASEHARRIAEGPPTFHKRDDEDKGNAVATVSEKGDLLMWSNTIAAERVPAFIVWLQRTFVDEEAKPCPR